MFISASKKECVIAKHAVVTGHGVTHNCGVGMPDVRSRIHIIDGGCDVELVGRLHSENFRFLRQIGRIWDATHVPHPSWLQSLIIGFGGMRVKRAYGASALATIEIAVEISVDRIR